MRTGAHAHPSDLASKNNGAEAGAETELLQIGDDDDCDDDDDDALAIMVGRACLPARPSYWT